MVDFIGKPHYGFPDLVRLVRVLRAPDGCPWDSVQTHESIRRNFIEEVYEACEAIDRRDTALLKEELGDVLLHVVFHAGIETDAGHFDIDDVCDGVVKKMISRHPDLFGGEGGLSWDEIKRREKGQTEPWQELDSVARSLPSLWRAEKIIKKADKAHLALPGDSLTELARQIEAGECSEETLGRLLFTAVDECRKKGIDPETALGSRCEAFIQEARECCPETSN